MQVRLLSIGFLVMSLGCTASRAAELPAAKADDGSAAPEEQANGAAMLSRLDAAVLGVALADLAGYASTDARDLANGEDGTVVWFSPETVQTQKTTENLLYQQDKASWQRLTAAQQGEVQEAASNLRERIGTIKAFEQFESLDKRVRVGKDAGQDPEKKKSILDRSRRPIRAWTPGYTKNRQFAMIRLVIPWSMHHAEGTYLLEQQDGKWSVCLRQFVYYP